MVDISKIQVGDEITVRQTVVDVSHGTIRVRLRYTDGVSCSTTVVAPADRIVAHIPKPREIEVGGWVTLAKGGGYSGGPRKVIALTDDEVCMLNRGTDRMLVCPRSELIGVKGP